MCHSTSPAEVISELLQFKGLSVKDFATKMDLSETQAKSLVEGKTTISNDTAGKLEIVFGYAPFFWKCLEKNHRRWQLS